MALLRRLIAGPPALNRHALSKEFCQRIGWFKPDGGLKDMMARVTMLAMHRDGLIVLPPPQRRQNRPGPVVFGQDTETLHPRGSAGSPEALRAASPSMTTAGWPSAGSGKFPKAQGKRKVKLYRELLVATRRTPFTSSMS